MKINKLFLNGLAFGSATIAVFALFLFSGGFIGSSTSRAQSGPDCSTYTEYTCNFLSVAKASVFHTYDLNSNGTIEISETLTASNNFLSGQETEQNTCAVVKAWQQSCFLAATGTGPICGYFSCQTINQNFYSTTQKYDANSNKVIEISEAVKASEDFLKGSLDNSTVCVITNAWQGQCALADTSNKVPRIIATPSTSTNIKAGDITRFRWLAGDDNSDNLSWRIEWGDGTIREDSCRAGQNKSGWEFIESHTWNKAGTYTLRARVSDCRGGTATHTMGVTVGQDSTAQLPDFVITDVQLEPTAPKVEESLGVRVTLKNLGGGITGFNNQINIIWRGQATDESAIFVYGAGLPFNSWDKDQTLILTDGLGTSFTPGIKNFEFSIKEVKRPDGSTITESNTSNNAYNKTFSVLYSPPIVISLTCSPDGWTKIGDTVECKWTFGPQSSAKNYRFYIGSAEVGGGVSIGGDGAGTVSNVIKLELKRASDDFLWFYNNVSGTDFQVPRKNTPYTLVFIVEDYRGGKTVAADNVAGFNNFVPPNPGQNTVTLIARDELIAPPSNQITREKGKFGLLAAFDIANNSNETVSVAGIKAALSNTDDQLTNIETGDIDYLELSYIGAGIQNTPKLATVRTLEKIARAAFNGWPDLTIGAGKSLTFLISGVIKPTSSVKTFQFIIDPTFVDVRGVVTKAPLQIEGPGPLRTKSVYLQDGVSDKPVIIVLYPNGGETWTFGVAQKIEWQATGVDKVDIYLKFSSDGATCKLVDGISAGLGGYIVTLTEGQKCPNSTRNITEGNYEIGVFDINSKSTFDYGDNNFKMSKILIVPDISTLLPPTNIILNTYLIQGGRPVVGLKWIKAQGAEHTRIYRSTLPGVLGPRIGSIGDPAGWADSEVENLKTYYYTFSSYSSTRGESEKTPQHKIVVINKEDPLKVLSPNGGEQWALGTRQIIKWQAPAATKAVDIFLFGSSRQEVAVYTVARSVPSAGSYNTGSYTWIVGSKNANGEAVSPGRYSISIQDSADALPFDQGDNPFDILMPPNPGNSSPKITATPQFPKTIVAGELVESLTWKAEDPDGDALRWSINWGEITDNAEMTQQTCGAYGPGGTLSRSHVWEKPGTYTLKVRVDDCKGGVYEHTTSIKVQAAENPTAPASTPAIKSIVGPTIAQIGETTTWRLSLKQLDIPQTVWVHWGDVDPQEPTATSMIPAGDTRAILRQVYSKPGVYAINFVVGTSGREAAQATKSIRILERGVRCLSDESLVRVGDDPRVYVIKNCARQWIPDQETFIRSGYDFNDVEEITAGVFNELTPAQQAEVREAINLMRAQGQTKVYRIIGGKKLWIPSAESFEAQRLDWQAVQNRPAPELDVLPRVKLLRGANDLRVYYITESGLKRHIPNEATFASYGNRWEDIVEVDSPVLESYADVRVISGESDDLLYLLENGTKRLIPSRAIALLRGIDLTHIAPVNKTEFNSYPTGTPVQ